jgi:hypothetical protein
MSSRPTNLREEGASSWPDMHCRAATVSQCPEHGAVGKADASRAAGGQRHSPAPRWRRAARESAQTGPAAIARAGYVKRAEFAKQFGAAQSDIAAVKKVRRGARPGRRSRRTRRAARSCCPARCPPSTKRSAWTCSSSSIAGGSYRGRTGPVHLPGRAEGRGRGRPGSRQPARGETAFPWPTHAGQRELARPSRQGDFVHPDHSRVALRLPPPR